VKTTVSFWLVWLTVLPWLAFATFQAAGQEIYSIFGPSAGTMAYAPAPETGTSESPLLKRARPVRLASTGGGAYCVRTCDGRYFPAPPGDRVSQAQACRNFCPASETKLFLGSSIEGASGVDGKSYDQLPNAFRYRTELISGCTCNGTSSAGLARVSIAQDQTLRSGDMVANQKGILVAASSARFRESMAAMKAPGQRRTRD